MIDKYDRASLFRPSQTSGWERKNWKQASVARVQLTLKGLVTLLIYPASDCFLFAQSADRRA